MGKVINGYWGGYVVDSIADRMLDPTGGSSFLEIIGGHHLSALFQALGTSFKHLSATTSIQYPTATVIDDESLKPTGRELENTLADNVAVNGEFKSGALFTIGLSSGRPPSPNGRNQYLLIIDGTKGSLKLESDKPFPGPHVRDARIYLNGEKMAVDGAGGLSTNIQNLWQAYAAGHDEEYPSLDDAVILRRALADIERSAQEGRRVYCQ
ncbi:hypothetical protein DL96DRAFT_1589768 [Flagelloscypha sp. PMI_526]|nr:hypothetical protein DL96DRAFT_1589768 [Flagelloscypha sp. PMI_526]